MREEEVWKLESLDKLLILRSVTSGVSQVRVCGFYWSPNKGGNGSKSNLFAFWNSWQSEVWIQAKRTVKSQLLVSTFKSENVTPVQSFWHLNNMFCSISNQASKGSSEWCKVRLGPTVRSANTGSTKLWLLRVYCRYGTRETYFVFHSSSRKVTD